MRGGFDVVLEAIRTEYKSNGLQVYDIDFFVVTRSSGGNGHVEDSESNDDTSTLRLIDSSLRAKKLYCPSWVKP